MTDSHPRRANRQIPKSSALRDAEAGRWCQATPDVEAGDVSFTKACGLNEEFQKPWLQMSRWD
jgi:hypothetical protein